MKKLIFNPFTCRFDWISIESISGQNHALLSNLDFSSSGHTDFQKKLGYDSDLKCNIVE